MSTRWIALRGPHGEEYVLSVAPGDLDVPGWERVGAIDAAVIVDRLVGDESSAEELLRFVLAWLGPVHPSDIAADLSRSGGSARFRLWRRPLARAAFSLILHTGEEPQLLSDLAPEPEPEQDTFFEVRLVDEAGDPLSGVELRWSYAGGPEDATTAGDGKSRLQRPLGPSFASVRLTNLDGLRDAIRPVWDQTGRVSENGSVEASEDVTVVFLRDGLDQRGFNLTKETPHDISIQPYVMLARLFGLTFESSKCFLMPEAIPSLRAMVRLYEGNPGSKLLLVGHTDTVGDPSYNDPLSLERAESMGAYLQDDVDAWLEWYGSGKPTDKRWGSREDELMIVAFIGEQGDPNRSPVLQFQEAFNVAVEAGELEGDPLAEDGAIGPNTRRALVTSYMNEDGTTLPDDVELTLHGCGENFPLDEEGDDVDDDAADEQEDATDRRVELFFFDHDLGVQPPPAGDNSGEGSGEYPEWRARASVVEDFRAGVQVPIFDWDEALNGGMPADAELTLNDEEHSMTIPWAAGARSGSRRRFVFGELTGEEPCTLVLATGGDEHVLLRDQQITQTDKPVQWEFWLEDFVANPDGLEEPETGAAMPELVPTEFEQPPV